MGSTDRRSAGPQPGNETTDNLRIDGLEVVYGRNDGEQAAVVDFTMDVRAGEFLTLIGPSGCGKTSVLRAAGGLLKPTKGEVRLGSSAVAGPRPDRIAYVFQNFALFPWRTALANVEIALELRGVGRSERRKEAMSALAQVGLKDAASKYPRELSGGMQQRVAVARALVSDCDVLLLDEPFGSLDEQTRFVLGSELLRLLESAGKTILFVTHSLQEAVFLSDRVVVMTARQGRIKQVIDVDIPRPRDPSVMVTERFHELQAKLFELLYEESTVALASE